MNHRDEKLVELIRALAAQFLERESNRASLITVTGVTIEDRGKHATILVTVLPIEKELQALEFANRQQHEFREFIKKHARIRTIPHVSFVADFGEKNRQRIDDISLGI